MTKATYMKLSISIKAEPVPSDDDLCRLRVSVSCNGFRVRMVIPDIRVNARGWSSDTEACKPRSYHGPTRTPASTINSRLESMRDGIIRNLNELDLSGVDFTTDIVRSALSNALTGTTLNTRSDMTVRECYLHFLTEGEETGRWSDATIKKLKVVEKHIKEVAGDMPITEFPAKANAKLLGLYKGKKGKYASKGLSNETIKKELIVTGEFLRWAERKGYCSASAFFADKPRLKSTPKTIVFLTREELDKVYRHNFKRDVRSAQVRDVFCFCAFTSLRYSDVARLKKTDIQGDAIHLVTVKTGKPLVIELNDYSREILKRYKKMPGEMALPVISNQKTNDRLKHIGEVCGINEPVTITTYRGNLREEKTVPKWKLLSTHAARRTFVSNALSMGIPPNIVMKWTGHNDYKAMKPYIDIENKAKKDAMKLFNKG